MGKFVSKRLKIGFLGGTFDPIHYGHLSVAEALFHTYNLDHVRLIPSGIPPHRELPSSSSKDRLSMLRRAVENIPYFKVDDIEISKAGFSYTIDTLVALQALFPHAQFVWALGTDGFKYFTKWRDWQTLLDKGHLAIAIRPGTDLNWQEDLPFDLKQQYDARLVLQEDRPYQILQGKISLLPTLPLEVSATRIRHALHKKESVRFFTPDAVIDYIHQHGLYK